MLTPSEEVGRPRARSPRAFCFSESSDAQHLRPACSDVAARQFLAATPMLTVFLVCSRLESAFSRALSTRNDVSLATFSFCGSVRGSSESRFEQSCIGVRLSDRGWRGNQRWP